MRRHDPPSRKPGTTVLENEPNNMVFSKYRLERRLSLTGITASRRKGRPQSASFGTLNNIGHFTPCPLRIWNAGRILKIRHGVHQFWLLAVITDLNCLISSPSSVRMTGLNRGLKIEKAWIAPNMPASSIMMSSPSLIRIYPSGPIPVENRLWSICFRRKYQGFLFTIPLCNHFAQACITFRRAIL